MPCSFASTDSRALPLTALEPDAVETWANSQDDRIRNWVSHSGFRGAIGTALMLPGPDGAPQGALVGYGTPAQRARGRFALAAGMSKLAPGDYRLVDGVPTDALESETLGALLLCYRFDRYRPQSAPNVFLVAPDGIDAARIEAQVKSETLTRDLINTPAADMGPSALEQAVRDLGTSYGASVSSIVGEDLLAKNFPMIHAVGRAASDAPRLIDLRWGTTGPLLTLVGKGVCFDTGGLNLKPGASMGLMKKDMGGAANVLGLGRTIMSLNLPLRLRILVPAVENSVSGNSFRPQDILTSRKGLTVEINNTDAEGRLVLADALALADEEPSDLLISMATLTGAARVAVGPDLAPFFTDDEGVASALYSAATPTADPVWRMPFYTPYEPMIEPGIADLDNAPGGGMAGAITAALFLRRFVTNTERYTHFDVYGWNRTAAPARPKGGIGHGQRAILAALPGLLNL